MSAQIARRKAEILLVEDNPGDVNLITEVLADATIEINFYSVEDGVEALAFLRRQDKYEAAVRPDLIILDLNLPRLPGIEVLAEIKQDKKLKLIPVIILSTSRSPEDIHQAYSYHANCYINKPRKISEFSAIAEAVEKFWFKIVQLPLSETDGW